MKLVIAKVDEIFFDGEASSVTAPGTEGELTVLSHHEPLVTLLKSGTIVVREGNTEKSIAIEGGVLEVHKDGATIIL